MNLEKIKDPKLRQRIQEQIYNEDRARSEAARSRPVVQEQEAGDPKRRTDDRPKSKRVDGKVHPKFRVTIVVRYSDNRRRDLDGAASTVLDCLVTAARRFAAMDMRAADRKR